MSASKAYQVIITKSRRLNILMANNSGAQLRTYSHFVTLEDARRFADILEASLAEGKYWNADRCQLCGEAFIRQNHLCLLKDGRIIHKKCLWRSVKRGEMSYNDCKEYWNHYFTQTAPAFDYCNLNDDGDRSRKFRYAIQTISREVIHIYLIEPSGYMKHHFCLTYDECQGLIREIRKKADQMEKYIDVTLARCACCGAEVCAADSYYVLASGELIHRSCLVRLVQSAPNRASFPGSMQKLMNPSL